MSTPSEVDSAPLTLDSQQVEIVGRNLLVAQLVADGLEVAVPQRDRGVDLVAYADRENEFVARPIQMKAATGRSFEVDRKYQRIAGLLLVHVWNVVDPPNTVTICLTYDEAVDVADSMGWTGTASWRENHRYTTTAPSKRLLDLLAPYEMHRGDWRARLDRSVEQPEERAGHPVERHRGR